METTKKCPYCGEVILAEAKKCKYCGEWMPESEGAEQPRPAAQQPIIQVVNTPTPTPAPAAKPSNGIGTAGMVLAILGLVFCWVPFLNYILIFLGQLFSFIGVFKKPRGKAIAGLVISVITIIIVIIISIFFSVFAEDIIDSIDDLF